MSFKNILVPHDFQDVAENALDNAIKIAKLSKDSKIIILHVIEEIPIPVMGTFFSKPLYSSKTGEAITPSVYIKEIFHDMRLDALKKLENKKQKCEKEDILCETKLIKGNPKKEITRYINQQKIDLVVIGTAKRKGMSKIMTIGSIARNIAEIATCPVMLVH
ncbi:MAG: universal stress protein [Nitrososphaeraceae archaeon]